MWFTGSQWKDLSNMVIFLSFHKNSSSYIFNELFDGLFRKACEKTTAAVNFAGYKGMNEIF